MSNCGKSLAYACVLILGPMTFGFINTFPNAEMQSFYSDYPDFNPDDAGLMPRFFDASNSLAAAFGGFIIFALTLKFSWRSVISVWMLITTVLWLALLGMSGDLFWYGILIRTLQGLALGGIATISPCYLYEIAPTGHTGFFATLNQAGIVIGQVVAVLIAAFIDWRIYIYIASVVSFLLCIGIWLVPESQYSVTNKHYRQKKKFLAKQPEAQWKMAFILLAMILQQFSGVNAILSNLTGIMKSTGLDIEPMLINAISTSSQLISVCIGAALMDILSRKAMWIISTAGISIFLLIYALNLVYELGEWVPALCIFLYLLFFGLGYGPIPWFLAVESFRENSILATSIVTCENMLFASIIVVIYPVMIEKITEFGAIMVFFGITFMSHFYGYYLIPEPYKEEGEGVSLI